MANPDEARLHYPLADRLPGRGETNEVAPGIRWLRMPLPFALDHINLWLLNDVDESGREGFAIVDCGIDDAATRSAWEAAFSSTLGGAPVLRVIVTHMHPDHIGLAHWLTERHSSPQRDCRLWISATDWNAARSAVVATGGVGGEGAARFFGRHGLTDPVALQRVRERRDHYRSLVPRVPDRFRRLMDGTELTLAGHTWHCIAGYGHAPEHMALFCPELKLLISGDMVLPRISTNVSVFDAEPEGNPLALYLASLERFCALPADTLVLPSHGKPFVGLHERIAQLQLHHERRLDEVRAACHQEPRSAADLLGVLFRRQLDLHQTTFAMGESIAHLHALASRGELAPRLGDDGVMRFGCAA